MLVEFLIGAAILVIAVTFLILVHVSQLTLSEHARHLALAVNDATRVMERLRRLNAGAGCLAPTVNPAALPAAECGGAPCPSWDQWLEVPAPGGGGKSLGPNPAANERVQVSCLDEQGGPCDPGDDPLMVTVAVCWRHRRRILGECVDGVVLTPQDGVNGYAADNVIQSLAMLSSALTCHQ